MSIFTYCLKIFQRNFEYSKIKTLKSKTVIRQSQVARPAPSQLLTRVTVCRVNNVLLYFVMSYNLKVI